MGDSMISFMAGQSVAISKLLMYRAQLRGCVCGSYELRQGCRRAREVGAS